MLYPDWARILTLVKRVFCTFLLAVMLVGCAAGARNKAFQTGQVVKELVDTSAAAVTVLAEARVKKCEPKVPEGRAAVVDCLGPFANPDKIDGIFEAARAAQLTLFIAIVSGASPDELAQAGKDLLLAATEVADLIKLLRSGGE